MTEGLYVVIRAHETEYPEPITLDKGDVVSVGQASAGPDGWDNWYLCSARGQKDGWVPGQIISSKEAGSGVITEAYTAKELNTTVGERLTGTRVLNGWLWAKRLSDGATGWVPMNTIRACASQLTRLP